MADVTGPISTLPRSIHKVPDNIQCDDCSENVASVRIQGETDSFGCKMIDLCDACYEAYAASIKNIDTSGDCEWCKRHAPKLLHARSYDEGMYGPVYEVCEECLAKYNKYLDEEMSRYDDYY